MSQSQERHRTFFALSFQVYGLMLTLIIVYVIYWSLQKIKRGQNLDKSLQKQQEPEVMTPKPRHDELERIEKASLSNLTEDQIDVHINDGLWVDIRKAKRFQKLFNNTE